MYIKHTIHNNNGSATNKKTQEIKTKKKERNNSSSINCVGIRLMMMKKENHFKYKKNI